MPNIINISISISTLPTQDTTFIYDIYQDDVYVIYIYDIYMIYMIYIYIYIYIYMIYIYTYIIYHVYVSYISYIYHLHCIESKPETAPENVQPST